MKIRRFSADLLGLAAARWEVLALTGIVILALTVRLTRLSTVPGNVTADELDNLQTAYRILAGTHPGLFALDWKPAPAFSTHLIAWSLQLFGTNIVAMRLPSVLLSTAALVAFYLIARQSVSKEAGLAATALLATNLWYLHFSRSGWENVHGALYATGAMLSLLWALRSGRLAYYAMAGVFCALGLLGYASGAFVVVGVLAYLPVALTLHRAQWRRILVGYGILLIVAGAIYAPQLKTIIENWDYATRRLEVVSVFSIEGEYLGDTTHSAILRHQVLRTVRGFLLMDNGVMGYGLWTRYIPARHGFLDSWTTVFLWIGLGAGLVRWRQTLFWWTMLLALLVPQVVSTGTPDGARGVIVAPVLYLFVALGVHVAFRALWDFVKSIGPSAWEPRLRVLTLAVLLLATGLIARGNVLGYFEWQRLPGTLQAREPAVKPALFADWQRLAMNAAREGRLLGAEWDAWLAAHGYE